MKKQTQTAVEWFVEALETIGIVHLVTEDILEQAKEMEKQEQQMFGIILAVLNEEIGDEKFIELISKAKQYYNETFKSDEKQN